MFKVKKQEMVNKTFRMPVELVEQLGEVAQKENISVNNLIIQCCEYALNDLVPQQSKNEKK